MSTFKRSRILIDEPTGFSQATQVGPLVKYRDSETWAVCFRQKYMQRAIYWQPQAIGTPGPQVAIPTPPGVILPVLPTGSYLTDETEPSGVDVAGLVTWIRNYACKPPDRMIPQEDTHNYQLISAGQLGSVPIPVCAQVFYAYFHTADPASIPLKKAYTLIQIGASLQRFGTPPEPGQTMMLGADEYLEPWRGLWWRKVSKMVPTPDFVPVT